MRTEDPWRGIELPATSDAINARRIQQVGTLTWGLYWAVDFHRQCVLILQHRASRATSQRLPRLRGLLVEEWPIDAGGGSRIAIRLTDNEQREIFHRFCVDVVDATRPAESDEDAIGRFLARTWRWHRLLRSGRCGRLRRDEQKGLIGEMRLLEERLLRELKTDDAVEAWVGPMGAPKDFQVGQVCIESKALSPQKTEVVISSVEQLDAQGASALLLYVTEVASGMVDSPDSVTVTDVADRIRSAIESRSVPAALAFEERLNAVGFDWNDDYSDSLWVTGKEMLFEVKQGFPCITRSMVPQGINNVRYFVALSACGKFRADMQVLTQTIRGASDAR